MKLKVLFLASGLGVILSQTGFGPAQGASRLNLAFPKAGSSRFLTENQKRVRRSS